MPPNSTVVGVPGRIVKRDNVRIPREDMDQVHFPDPLQRDMSGLQEENYSLKCDIDKLTKRLDELEKMLKER